MLEFRYDTQLLIECSDGTPDEQTLSEYIQSHFRGDSLMIVRDDRLINLHFHTNEPWDILKYCATLGDVYNIAVENMERQTRGDLS